MRWILLSFLALAGCTGDETLTKYGAAGKTWTLTELRGAAAPSGVTIGFRDDGTVSGQGPCNRYFGTQTKPYPWIEISEIGSTKMACPNLKSEALYFDVLRAAHLVDVSGDVLILSDDTDAPVAVFVAAPES